jgi:hypothetical protein
MRFIMMMNVPRGSGDYQISNWSPEDFQAHIAFMHRYNKDLTEAGEFVDAQGLTPPSEAKLVRAGKDGAPVTDGVFPESKEFLAGYWIIDVDSPERAYELAAKASAAPGPGGAPLNMPIEVRQVMSGPLPDA